MDAKTMCRRQATGTQTTPAFDALLHRPFIRDDSEILPVWTRYLAGRKDADFQALVCHYLPLVLIVASALKRRANGAFREDTDAYLSDGILGLCRAIRYIKSFDAEKFGGSATIAVRRAIMGEMRARKFGGRREAGRLAMIYVARSKLARRLGRPATREELAAELAGRVHNPARFVERYDRPAPAVHTISGLETKEGRRFDVADPRVSDPAAGASEDETIRLALGRLGKTDREIFEATLRGDSRAVIARRLGISRERVRQRLNRAAWLLRSYHKLAMQFDVQAEPVPDRPGRPWPALKNLPSRPKAA